MPDKQAWIERALIGRDTTEADKAARVRIIPLPSVGHSHANHLIRRLLIEIPPNCPIPAGDIEWGFSGLDLGPDMDTGDSFEISGRVLIPAAEKRMLEWYCSEASTWRTVTPAALPQFAARQRLYGAEGKVASQRIDDERRAVAAVAQALRHAGVAARAAEIGSSANRSAGTANASRSLHREPALPAELWHVEIAFSRPLSGPLVIGDGRYPGLALWLRLLTTGGT